MFDDHADRSFSQKLKDRIGRARKGFEPDKLDKLVAENESWEKFFDD